MTLCDYLDISDYRDVLRLIDIWIIEFVYLDNSKSL